jgi:hypothetical protein
MPDRKLWIRNVPRVECNHHARETRLQLEYLERLLAKRDAAEGFRYLRLLLLLLGNIAGSGRRRGRRTGSLNNRRPCHIGMLRPAFILIRQPAVIRGGASGHDPQQRLALRGAA